MSHPSSLSLPTFTHSSTHSLSLSSSLSSLILCQTINSPPSPPVNTLKISLLCVFFHYHHLILTISSLHFSLILIAPTNPPSTKPLYYELFFFHRRRVDRVNGRPERNVIQERRYRRQTPRVREGASDKLRTFILATSGCSNPRSKGLRVQ